VVSETASLLTALALAVGSASVAQGPVIYAGGAWAAIDRGGVCERLSASQTPPRSIAAHAPPA